MTNVKRGDQWVEESAHAETLSEIEVPQIMALVLLHGATVPGSPGSISALFIYFLFFCFFGRGGVFVFKASS